MPVGQPSASYPTRPVALPSPPGEGRTPRPGEVRGLCASAAEAPGTFPESMDVQARMQVVALPTQVRLVLEAFTNGSLPAGQLCDALSRAWALETPEIASYVTPLPTQTYAT